MNSKQPLHHSYSMNKRSWNRTPRSLAECEFEPTGSPLPPRREQKAAGIVLAVVLAIGFAVALWAAIRT